MSTDLNAKITLSGLKHYHGRIFTNIITPIHTILFNNASDEDIGKLFIEEPVLEPNTVKFVGVDSDSSNVSIINSSGNTVDFDGNEVVLPEGTYSIVIKMKNASASNGNFVTTFEADGTSALIIKNPVLMSKITSAANLTTPEGITALESNWKLFDHGSTYISGRSYYQFSVGDEIIFFTEHKMILKRILFGLQGYAYTTAGLSSMSQLQAINYDYTDLNSGQKFWYYGSNDGENWTLIGGEHPRHYVLIGVNNEDMYYNTKNPSNSYLPIADFSDENNHGYTYHKLVIKSLNNYNPGRIYTISPVEAYWVE